MKELKVAMPVIVALLAAVNIGVNFMDGNTNAVWANVSALCGWMIVAGDNIVTYLNERPYRV